jgi:flagellar basal body-associated protein FliL
MEQAVGEVPRVEKKGKGRMVGILVALVLVLSAGAAGAVFAPRLLSKPAPQEKATGEEEAEHGEEAAADEHAEAEKEEEPAPTSSSSKRRKGPVGEVLELQPVVVDIRAEDNSVRHIKVQLAVELPKEKKADDFKKFVPFAREAAISYLRVQDYDRLADAKAFESIKKELGTEIIDAVGKAEARRILIVDFVVQ